MGQKVVVRRRYRIRKNRNGVKGVARKKKKVVRVKATAKKRTTK